MLTDWPRADRTLSSISPFFQKFKTIASFNATAEYHIPPRIVSRRPEDDGAIITSPPPPPPSASLGSFH